MTNAINLQGFYTTFTQSATKQNASQSADFQNSLSDYQANMEKLWHNNATDETDLNMQIYSKSQSILGEVSQSRYERTLKSLLAKVQNFMQGIQKDSFAYDFVDDIYGNVIFWAEPEKVFIKNNRTNLHEKANILTLVQESKDKFLSALHNQSPSINQDFEEFKERLLNYKSCLEMVRTSFLPFFAAFKSEFSESEMQEIIDELATIQAYNDYKAHNISLADGSTISWSYDKNGNMLVKINEFDINTALENADKALTEMENFKTLLEMFKKRENLNGLESGLNSENLHSNSHSNLTNSSENLGKNSNLQAKLNLINLSTNSKQNLNFNTLNSSENLIANLNANSTQQSEISTPNSTNLSLQNSNHRFTMLVERENVTSIISSQSANGDTIIGMWSPMIREKGAQETSRYLSNLINSNSKVAQKPSKAEFERAVKNISALMNELKNFVRSEQGYSQLSVDLQYLTPDDYERTLYESMQTSSNNNYDSLWMGAQIFFDFLNDKVSGLPKDEINAYISTIQAYLVATKLNANELKLTQNSLNFNSENLKLNDSLLKELLKSV